jgi:hypothetical protein
VARRNTTRWNSEHRLLASSLALKSAIVQVTMDPELKLGAYRLTDDEWKLASDVYDMLEVFFCVAT